MFPLACLFLLFIFNVAVECQTPVPPATFPPFSSVQTSTSVVHSTTKLSQSVTSIASTTSTSPIPFPSLGGYSPCVTNCLATGIARVNCSSIVDVNCFCVKDNFTAELVACILANCAEEIHTAENLAQRFCNIASGTPSLSFPPVPTTTTSSITSSTTTETSSATSPPSTPSTGGSLRVGINPNPVWAGTPVMAAICIVSAFLFGLRVTL